MKFFSGFCFQNEKELFSPWLVEGDYVVAGFSKGAIDAFEYVYNSDRRVDRLILLSPAFFQNRTDSFKKLQLKAFKRDRYSYIQNFYNNCRGSSSIDISAFRREGTIDELQELLYYEWSVNKIKNLKDRGVIIEIFMGSDDKIINTEESLNFFKNLSSFWYIKGVGHLLR